MTDRLTNGQSLQPSESLASPNGSFSLSLQTDGNLVLYDQDGQPVWASGTDGREVGSATMQEDGNLVLNAPDGGPVWASDSYGNDGAYVVVQDDRNVVIYSADGAPVWATNTAV